MPGWAARNLTRRAKYAVADISNFLPPFPPFLMATNQPADNEQNRPTDPAQLGGDQGPATTPEDDARDMSPIMADADKSRTDENRETSQQGSDFNQQRQQGAEGQGDSYGATGRGQGMGHAADSGDEDRGYDQSGYRGGLGASGGRENLSDRNTDTNQNPFVGGYDGGGTDRPTEAQTKDIGLDAPQPNSDSDKSPTHAKAE